jgi:hypothetical protein
VQSFAREAEDPCITQHDSIRFSAFLNDSDFFCHNVFIDFLKYPTIPDCPIWHISCE